VSSGYSISRYIIVNSGLRWEEAWLRIEKVCIDKIELGETQLRRSLDPEAVSGLAASIKEAGLLHPILVEPLSSGRYRLLVGERRLMAVKQLGWPAIDAVLVTDPTPSRIQVQLIENLQRKGLNPLERARAIHQLMLAEGLTKAAASESLGIPRTTLTEWLNILDVDPEYQQAVVDNYNGGDSPLTLSHVSVASGLAAKLGSPKILRLLLDAVLDHGLSKKETREVANYIRKYPDSSISQAIQNVRRCVSDSEEEDDTGSRENEPVAEEQVRRLVASLEKVSSNLAELGHSRLGLMSEGNREQLVQRLLQVYTSLEIALARLLGVTVTEARELVNEYSLDTGREVS